MHKNLKRMGQECNVSPELTGDVSGLRGDVSGLAGDVSGLAGDVSGLRGNVSGLWGNVDTCDLSAEDRTRGVDIADLVG